MDDTRPKMTQPVYFSNIHWKEALESAGQGVWDYDIITGEKFYSDTWRAMRGLMPGEREPQTDEEWLEKIHPDDRDLALDRTNKLNAGELREVNFEYRERHRDGHWIWIMCRGRPISWDPRGNPCRFVGTDTDISRLKESEDRIKSVSRRLELALSSVQIGVWNYDLTLDRVEWDMRLRTIYGLPADLSPLPRDIWERSLHPDDRDAAIGRTQLALESGNDYDLNYRIIRTDGQTRYIRSRVSFQKDLIGGPILVGINWDATEDAMHAEALARANQHAAVKNAELETARAEMEYNSLHDALTGLPNRRMLDQVQQAQVGRDCCLSRRFAVLHIDLDRFKQINDAFGHAVGDFVLQNTARILGDCAPQGSLVARVGGDEFALFVPDAAPDSDLALLAARLINAVAKPIHHGGSECRYGISIGIAVADGPQADGSALFINADLALYRAKNGGRGRYCFFTDAMRSAALAHKQKCDEILAGIERDEFFCVYQPQFDANTRQLTGVEALVRWQTPNGEVLLPADFLTTAEDLNVLGIIDRIVLQKAVADFGCWAGQGLKVPRLSVNLSKARLRDPDLAAELASLNIDHGVLSMELLESNFLDDQTDEVAANLAAIKQLGIGIEVDDFGTGHASIVSLLRLNPDRLKIDRALVEPIVSSERQVQLLRSIVDIGHLQGISIIAEGVETDAQILILQAIGCDEFQGHALARPMTPAALVQFLQGPQCSAAAALRA